MRNIFDQYTQPENRLTHALACALANDRRLLRPFLKWLKVQPVPALHGLRVVEQQVPGIAVSGDEDKSKGLPDACIFSEDGWALLVESKVQEAIDSSQIKRHLKTAARHGYDNASVLVIAVDRPNTELPGKTPVVEWRELYRWFRRFARRSFWAKAFVDYLQDFEKQMTVKDYLTQGTLTMFDGLCFDDENPYTHREAKRLIRLLREELRQRKDLYKLGVSPDSEGRPALTGRGFDLVWDFLPVTKASGDQPHTAHPHLTMSLNRDAAVAAVTVPNGVKGGFRTKLEKMRIEGFRQLVEDIECRLRPVVARSRGSSPRIYVTQRHYPSLKSPPIVDGRLDVDLRTLTGCKKAGVKCQPEWIDAIYYLLTQKQSNIQLGVDVQFRYTCSKVRSTKVVDLFAETWVALKPLLDFVLSGD